MRPRSIAALLVAAMLVVGAGAALLLGPALLPTDDPATADGAADADASSTDLGPAAESGTGDGPDDATSDDADDADDDSGSGSDGGGDDDESNDDTDDSESDGDGVDDDSDGSGEDGTEDPVVVDGDLGTDAGALFRWTEDATDRDVEAPRVEVRDASGIRPTDPFEARGQSFVGLLLTDGGYEVGAPQAYATDDRVVVFEDALEYGREREVAYVDGLLVHEFTHVVQQQTPAMTDHRPGFDVETDRRIAWTAVVEGSAEFVAENRTEFRWTDEMTTRYENGSAADRYLLWPYYRGYRYVDRRADGPADHWSVYESAPNTTAGVLRGEPNATAPDLAVTVEADDYAKVGGDRGGAVLVETALSKELPLNRSVAVAKGWRSDLVADVATDDGQAHVWVTQWRDGAAADAFEAAMADYLDARGTATGDRWTGVGNETFRVERTGDGTVAVIAGPETFVGNVTVAPEGEGTFAVVEDDASASPAADARLATAA